MIGAVRLRLLTLNVWGLPWPASRDRVARIQAIGNALPGLDVDVAAFQEVWTESVADALISAGREAGFESAWHRSQALWNSGLLVLSKLPIKQEHFEPFALNGFPERIDHADYYGGKGFSMLRLATEGGDVVVVVTHLQAGYGKRAHGYVGHRTAQVVSMAAALRSLRDPVVVLGDLNFQDMYEEHLILMGLATLRDVALELDQREDTVLRSNTYRSSMQASSSRIDFVLARDGVDRSLRSLSTRRVLAESILIDGRVANYSNHAGLRGEFAIEPGGTPIAPPRAESIELARSLLEVGRLDAEQRQASRRLVGVAAGLATIPTAWLARRSGPLSRRRFLRACGIGGAALATGLGGGALWLSEGFGHSERLAYDDTLRMLEEIERGDRA